LRSTRCYQSWRFLNSVKAMKNTSIAKEVITPAGKFKTSKAEMSKLERNAAWIAQEKAEAYAERLAEAMRDAIQDLEVSHIKRSVIASNLQSALADYEEAK
jgi:hypothetical protein